MLKGIKRSWAAVALVLAVAASGFAAAPPVLDQVPAESIVVVVVKDLKGLSTKAGNLATRMGLPMVPADLLSTMAMKLQINKGLDQNGSAAFFSVLPPEPKEGEIAPVYQKPFVLLLPTTDAKAMTAAFKPSPAENGISEVTVPDDAGQAGYIATVGNYVAFAQDRDFLQFYLANKKASISSKLSPESVTKFENNDLAVYVNVQEFAPCLKQMDAVKPLIKGMMVAARQPGVTDTEVALQQAYVELAFNGFRQILSDEQAGMVTLRLSDAGITFGSNGQYKAGSELAKTMGSSKPLGPGAMEGLMPGNVLAAGAVNWDPASIKKIMDAYFQPLAEAAKANNDPNAEAIKSTVQAMSDSLSLATGIKAALYEPQAGQSGLYHGVMLTQTTQVSKYMELQQQVYKNQMKEFESISPGMKIKMISDPAGLDADGVHFSKNTMTFTPDADRANTEQGQMIAKLITVLYGENGIDVCSGAVTKDQVLTTFGLGAGQVDAAAAAAHGKKDLTKAAEYTAANKEVLPNAFAVAYLPLDNWLSTYMKLMMGGNAPANGAAVSPPVVISAAATANSMSVEMHLPTATMASIVQKIWAMEGPTAGGPMAVPPPQN